MQAHSGAPGGIWTALLPLIFIGIALVRGSQARNLRVERLWISPVIVLVGIGLTISQTPPASALGIALDVLAIAIGAGMGWWRGRSTNITVNPDTHALTSKASAVGMILILGIFAVRYAMRTYASESASLLHASVNDISDAVLLLAVGLVCAQRLEMWLRARRLLEEARAAITLGAPASVSEAPRQ